MSITCQTALKKKIIFNSLYLHSWWLLIYYRCTCTHTDKSCTSELSTVLLMKPVSLHVASSHWNIMYKTQFGERLREIQRPVVPLCGVEQPCSVFVFFGHTLASMSYEVSSHSRAGWVGVNPATHKICKNNAIILTVYKDPEVNMLVKVHKSMDHENVLFSVCFIFSFFF